jgi:hypothetical protein
LSAKFVRVQTTAPRSRPQPPLGIRAVSAQVSGVPRHPRRWTKGLPPFALTRLASLATLSRSAGEGLFISTTPAHRHRPARPAGRMARVISRKPNATAGAQEGP